MTLNRLSRWLAIAGGAVLLWTLILALRGSGWSVTLLGLRLSSRDPYRSLVTGALRMLREHGHASYVLLDGYEVATFRGRYARVTDLAWLDRLPLGTIDRRGFLYEVP